MWVVTAALLLAAPAAEGADQPSAHADGSLLPDHQQLIADRVSTPALDKLLAEPKKNSSKGVVHSAIWEAQHSGTKTSSSSKVDLRKTKSKDDEPEDHEDQGEQEEHEGHDEHKEPKQQEQQGQ